MMLFEAMPLTLHSSTSKRRRLPSHDEEQPLPKKIALERQQASKYEKQFQEPSWNRKLDDYTSSQSHGLANGSHLKKLPSLPASSKGTAEKRRTTSSKKELSVRSQCCDSGNDAGGSNDAQQLNVNGIGQGKSGKGLDDLVGLTSKATDNSVKSMKPKSDFGMITHSKKQMSLLQKDDKPVGNKSKSSMNNRNEVFSSMFSDQLSGGYLRRMASLNASACVSAMMEPEKRYLKPRGSSLLSMIDKSQNEQELKQSDSSSSSEDQPSPWVSPVNSMQYIKESLRPRGSSPRYLKLSSSSCSSSEADSSKAESDDLEVTEPQQILSLLALATLATAPSPSSSFEVDDIPYNKLGLLYNGDTLYPSARVFYNSDVDITVPDRVIPRVVPSRDEFVGLAISDALAQKSVGKKRKAAKANNGWMPLGNAIKAIEYKVGPTPVVRRYYAGIKRNHAKEIICIRDSVLIRSGDSNADEERPYVAKIASIWQEQPGRLMMTVFWYYRPHELDSLATQGLTFRKDELLGSQHHDDNSVACIEEKCYILGVSQYCRYQAYIQSKRDQCNLKHRSIVPIGPRSHRQTENSEAEQTSALPSNGGGNDFESLTSVEPELVYLCYRGYNHCAAKIVSKSSPK